MNNIIKTWLFVGLMAATVGAADKLKAPEKTVKKTTGPSGGQEREIPEIK